MAEVHQAPAGGKGGDPRAPTTKLSLLSFRDPDAVRAWLTHLRAQIEDVVAAGDDATRAPGERRLGRAAAREAIEVGRRALEHLLAAADRAVAPQE